MGKYQYPYCKHGIYVGGCGIDYTCGTCELGEPDPTLRELQQEMQKLDKRLDQKVAEIEALGIDNSIIITPKLWAVLLDGIKAQMSRLQAEIDYVASLSNNPDDREWLNREHERKAREWAQMDDDDQFWSVPDYVLNSPY